MLLHLRLLTVCMLPEPAAAWTHVDWPDTRFAIDNTRDVEWSFVIQITVRYSVSEPILPQSLCSSHAADTGRSTRVAPAERAPSVSRDPVRARVGHGAVRVKR